MLHKTVTILCGYHHEKKGKKGRKLTSHYIVTHSSLATELTHLLARILHLTVKYSLGWKCKCGFELRSILGVEGNVCTKGLSRMMGILNREEMHWRWSERQKWRAVLNVALANLRRHQKLKQRPWGWGERSGRCGLRQGALLTSSWRKDLALRISQTDWPNGPIPGVKHHSKWWALVSNTVLATFLLLS